jgi:hypothetical protein
MNREMAGLSDYMIVVVFTTLARKLPRTINVRNTDVFLGRDLGVFRPAKGGDFASDRAPAERLGGARTPQAA